MTTKQMFAAAAALAAAATWILFPKVGFLIAVAAVLAASVTAIVQEVRK